MNIYIHTDICVTHLTGRGARVVVTARGGVQSPLVNDVVLERGDEELVYRAVEAQQAAVRERRRPMSHAVPLPVG